MPLDKAVKFHNATCPVGINTAENLLHLAGNDSDVLAQHRLLVTADVEGCFSSFPRDMAAGGGARAENGDWGVSGRCRPLIGNGDKVSHSACNAAHQLA